MCSECVLRSEKSLQDDIYKIVDFYPRVRVNYVNEESLRAFADIDTAFFNVNTPVDLIKARGMADKKE